MSGNGSNRRCIFTLFLSTHVFLPTILESFSEKYEEKISGLSYTANVNRKTVDSNGISHIQEHRSAALPVELPSHWERCARLIQFKCTRHFYNNNSTDRATGKVSKPTQVNT